jgi:Uma2 family endonuclease
MQKIKTIVTLADLHRLDADERDFDVENGEIILREETVTFLHLIIIQNLFRSLDPFVRLHRLGTVYMDGVRYLLAGTPQDIERTRKPDFSFLRAGRIPADFDWTGDFVGAPDFAVEVASPGQTNTILLPKITRYLEAGTEEAWLIYPWHKTVHQYRRDAEAPLVYQGAEVIDVSALFPGLTLITQDVFVTETV